MGTDQRDDHILLRAGRIVGVRVDIRGWAIGASSTVRANGRCPGSHGSPTSWATAARWASAGVGSMPASRRVAASGTEISIASVFMPTTSIQGRLPASRRCHGRRRCRPIRPAPRTRPLSRIIWRDMWLAAASGTVHGGVALSASRRVLETWLDLRAEDPGLAGWADGYRNTPGRLKGCRTTPGR